MFIINEVLKKDKIPADKMDEFFKQHVEWFTHHFEEGNFVLVGPYTDQEMVGIMLSPAKTREDVENILKSDVYYAGGMAEYEVHSFTAAKISPKIMEFVGK